ncbi:Lpg1974 family pore-forming outer membrane protein [Planctomycetaceae bacterium SH139]
MRTDGTGAAETVVMLRTKLSLSRILTGLAACCALGVTSSALAGPPQVPGSVEPDYEASGFVVPAGYAEPAKNNRTGGVMHANAPYGQMPVHPVQQTGMFSGHMGGHMGGPMAGCDTGRCDAAGGCMSCGSGDWQCAGGCNFGGLFGAMHCDDHSGMSKLRHVCLFCQSDGCGVCQSLGRANMLGLLAALGPYTEAGLGAQRWYDISAEVLFLRLDTNARGFDVTSRGQGPNTNIVLRSNDAMDDSMQAGARLSASMIFGVGGNLEVTYMGTGEFGDSRTVFGTPDVNGNPTPDLFSFISNFGQNPNLGFDDTDQSLSQSISTTNRFHSGEVNYRRRWVGPYSRFQGSWLAGIRYIDYDDQFSYRTVGLINNGNPADGQRFLNSQFRASNSMTGFQVGGDLWWNMYPGLNLGVGVKGAVMGNTSRLEANVAANSLGPGNINFPFAVADRVRNSETAWLTELNATLLYRFSYSWTLRSSFHVIDITDVALGSPALQTTNFTGLGTNNAAAALAPLTNGGDLTLTGFTVGLEYLW